MSDSHWKFAHGPRFNPSPDELKKDYGMMVGFVYLIEFKPDRKFYIGSKMIWETRKLKPLKGKKRSRRKIYETDWRRYTGSSNSLNAEIEKCGKRSFNFYIVKFYDTKARLKYAEQKAIFMSDAVLKPNYYNAFVGCRLSAKALGVSK